MRIVLYPVCHASFYPWTGTIPTSWALSYHRLHSTDTWTLIWSFLGMAMFSVRSVHQMVYVNVEALILIWDGIFDMCNCRC